MRRLFCLLNFLLVSAGLASAESRPLIGTLHPLLTEFTQRLAGDYVIIEELMPPSGDPHSFEPTPGDLQRIYNAALILAMGKNLETYLDNLQAAVSSSTSIYEVGRLVPSVRIDIEDPVFMCCPVHSHGAIDPHWWQSPMSVHRAVRHLGRELEKLLPEHRETIRENTRAYMGELNELHAWIESEVSKIPKRNRKLVIAHASFGYFCKAYGFQMIPVRGLTTEREPTASHLADSIRIIRDEGVRAVFPEHLANPAALDFLREETGTLIAEPLYSDNVGIERLTYQEMIRHNVSVMVRYLSEPEVF